MFKKAADKLVCDGIERGIIKHENRDEYIYGVNAFFTVAVNIFTALAVGIITHMLFEISVFLITFKLLRRYAGGAHEKTALRCYISSFVTYAVVLIAIKYYFLPSYATDMAVIISSVFLYITSPVEAPNKPLDDLERRVFRRRSRITIVFFAVVYFMARYIPIDIVTYASKIIAVSIITVTVFAIEGILVLMRNKKRTAV